jgi:NAD(P)-dependent dehydrogenase (short-subunit alcohol dehydrogenase family)
MAVVNGTMRGKVCLVTGATSGIGRETAFGLAARGATTLLAARDEARAKATVDAIRRETGNADVDFVLADLSEQAQVRRMAAEVLDRYPRLYVLVNNAGAMFWRRRVTADGLEMTFALDHLAPFLLTNLLLDRLKASIPSRVVTVASEAHEGAQVPFDDLQQEHTRYRPLRVYGQAKLANLLFTYELARRLAGTGVTANALHPGFVASNFAQGNSQAMKTLMLVTRPFSISPQEGAKTSIYLAASPEVESVSGEYFIKCKPARSSAASYDEAAARRLWDASMQLTGLTGGREHDEHGESGSGL